MSTRVGNRDKLLRGARKCLREKGYARTTARDLAAASDANLASIGYHFRGKQALLDHAAADGVRAWTEARRAAAFGGAPASVAEGLRDALAPVERLDALEPDPVSVVEAFAAAARSPELRESMAEAYEELRRAGAALLERAQAAEAEPDPQRARVLASAVVALADGLILQWLLDPKAIPSWTEVVNALLAL